MPGTYPVGMIGGGSFGWAPGEWTDDTSMAVAIAEVTAAGGGLEATLDEISVRWAEWRSAPRAAESRQVEFDALAVDGDDDAGARAQAGAGSIRGPQAAV